LLKSQPRELSVITADYDDMINAAPREEIETRAAKLR
jgi:hypothetical protein